MNARKFAWVSFGLVLALSCKNSKYCDTSSPTCPSGMTCDTVMHACVSGAGGTGGVGGAGGVGGHAGSGGGGGRFSCLTTPCSGNDGSVCDPDAGICVECLKDTNCTEPTRRICENKKCGGCSSASQCAALDAGTSFCSSDSGACVECRVSSDCTHDATKPICNASGTCVPCTTDSQCVAKASSGPGVCMFHQDGHCATDAETVYVEPSSSTCLPSAVSAGGTASMPFCHLSDAVTSAGSRQLIVLRGDSIAGGVTIQGGLKMSLVGQSATGAGGAGQATVTAGAGQNGLHITGADVYVRAVQISGTSTTAAIGIVADGSATIRLDGVTIQNMPQGGLRVTASSGYDVINSIFAGNGGTRDDGNRFVGGVWIDTPPSNQVSRFAFNTVVGNKRDGVTCAAMSQTIDGSLLAGNFSGVADNTGCTLTVASKALGTTDPMLTTTYRLTATSPCVDSVTTPPANPPDHDVDAITRPQGARFDCGASEYKPSP